MFDLIIKVLELGDLYGISKEIDIAKGINKMPLSVSEAWQQRKRKKAWQQKR